MESRIGSILRRWRTRPGQSQSLGAVAAQRVAFVALFILARLTGVVVEGRVVSVAAHTTRRGGGVGSGHGVIREKAQASPHS